MSEIDHKISLDKEIIMSFPVYARDGVYILSDSSKVKGKQAAIDAEANLPYGEVKSQAPEDYDGPTCPKCGDYRIRVLSAEREAAECREPTHRKAVGVKMIPALYVCPCGKRFSVK